LSIRFELNCEQVALIVLKKNSAKYVKQKELGFGEVDFDYGDEFGWQGRTKISQPKLVWRQIALARKAKPTGSAAAFHV
jgi:hypothetical protein